MYQKNQIPCLQLKIYLGGCLLLCMTAPGFVMNGGNKPQCR